MSKETKASKGAKENTSKKSGLKQQSLAAMWGSALTKDAAPRSDTFSANNTTTTRALRVVAASPSTTNTTTTTTTTATTTATTATTPGLSTTKHHALFPNIADDNDPLVKACAKTPLPELTLLPPSSIKKDLDETRLAQIKTTTSLSDTNEQDDIGSKGRTEAQLWINVYAGKDATSPAPQLHIHNESRALNLNEFLSLQMIVDFFNQFGRPLLHANMDADLSLASLLDNLHSNTHLHPLYTPLIHHLHSHDKKWQTMCTPIETRALLIHHLLTLPSTSTSSSHQQQQQGPSIDALITFFNDLSFPEIPAPVHIRMLVLLVEAVMHLDRFHDFVEKEVVGALESVRKQAASNVKQRHECKASIKSVEAEIEADKLEIRRMERQMLVFGCKDSEVLYAASAAASPASVGVAPEEVTPAEGVAPEDAAPATSIDSPNPSPTPQKSTPLSTLQSRLTTHQTTLQTLHKTLDTLDVTEKHLKHSLDSLPHKYRSPRFLGHDRDFSTYLWIDMGPPTQQPPPSFGILVLPTDESLPPKHIASIPDLISLIKSLNDRGHRDRDLLTSLRDRLHPYSLTVPAFTTSHVHKRWDRLGAREDEASVQNGFESFTAQMQRLGVLEPFADSDQIENYESQVLNGIRARVKELMESTGGRTRDLDPRRVETVHEFVDLICDRMQSVYGEEVGQEVRDRVGEVRNGSLFAVAVGFLAGDVRRGKFGDGVGEGKKGVVKGEEDGDDVKMKETRSGRLVRDVNFAQSPFLKRGKKAGVARSGRHGGAVMSKLSRRAKVVDLEQEDSENESDDDEDSEDSEAESEESGASVSGEEEDEVSHSSRSTRASGMSSRSGGGARSQGVEEVPSRRGTRRKRTVESEDDKDDEEGATISARVTRARKSSAASAEPSHKEAIAKLAQSRSERLARRAK
ncbi:hypothetical protein HDU98_001345 [Podochytrium sp. JEL0797]|nr:hypothetical protein HDU98_001345 [Podochytrium sp. JEL0797]